MNILFSLLGDLFFLFHSSFSLKIFSPQRYFGLQSEHQLFRTQSKFLFKNNYITQKAWIILVEPGNLIFIDSPKKDEIGDSCNNDSDKEIGVDQGSLNSNISGP